MSNQASQLNLLSTYREVEVQGAELLQRLLRDNCSSEMILHLTQQLADEARHIQVLTDLIDELGGKPTMIRKKALPSQCSLGRPTRTLETLAYLQAIEQRLQQRYRVHVAQRGEDAGIVSTLQALVSDEEWHLVGVRALLAQEEKRFGRTRVAATVDYYWDLVRQE